MKKPKMLLIEWWDAYAQIEPEPTPADIDMVIQTLGFQLPEDMQNERYLGYAQDYNEKLGVYQGITYIPRMMVKRWSLLAPSVKSK